MWGGKKEKHLILFYQKGPGISQADASILCLMHVSAGTACHLLLPSIETCSPWLQHCLHQFNHWTPYPAVHMWGSCKRWRTSCYVKLRLHCCLLTGANWLRRDAERMSEPSVTVSLRWLRITSGYKSVYHCRGFKEKPQTGLKSFLRFTWAIDMALNINQNKLR